MNLASLLAILTSKDGIRGFSFENSIGVSSSVEIQPLSLDETLVCGQRLPSFPVRKVSIRIEFLPYSMCSVVRLEPLESSNFSQACLLPQLPSFLTSIALQINACQWAKHLRHSWPTESTSGQLRYV